MEVVLLRFDAPLMSFGSVVVDHKNGTDSYPYRAMLTGLLANALGLTRAEADRHEDLQTRLRYAARIDREGTVLSDFQTVDFDPEGTMGSDLAWTTRGRLEERKGGSASEGTHIRERQYIAGAVLTVAVTFDPVEGPPSLRELSQALRLPARPLFLGRKSCVPSVPVWLGEMSSPSLRHALEALPRVPSGGRQAVGSPGRTPLRAVWPKAEGFDEAQHRLWPRVEDRDWSNSIHVGRRVLVEGLVDPPSAVLLSWKEPTS